MKKSFYFVMFILIIYACGQSNSRSYYQVNSRNDFVSIDSSHIKQTPYILTNLDSIDKTNNESVVASGDNINKAFVFVKDGDSTINMTANIRMDHRIFGYSAPDIHSERLLLLSVFSNDVENNPFRCKLGAYYNTRDMDDLTLKFIAITENFVRAELIDKYNNHTTIYFEKKWINIE